MLIDSLNFAFFLTLLVVLLAIYLTHQWIIKPYLLLSFYGKQGGKVKFTPGAGMGLINTRNAMEKGDFFYYYKKCIEANPDLKFFASNFGSDVAISLCEPSLIKESLTTHRNDYEKSPYLKFLLKDILYSGVILSDGENWKRNRKHCSAILHRDLLKEMPVMIAEVANKRFEELASANTLNNVDVMDELKKVTGEIIGTILLGDSLNHYSFEGQSITVSLQYLLDDLVLESHSFWNLVFAKVSEDGVLPRHRKLIKRIRAFRSMIADLVKERRNAFNSQKTKGECQQRKDLLDTLFEAQDQEKDGVLLDSDIVDDLITMLIGGMESTGVLLTMTLVYLDKYPEYKYKVKAEFEDISKDKESPLQYDDLNKMIFTMAILKESLRLVSPVPLSLQRIAIRDHKLGDILVKKGTLVNHGFLFVCCNEKYFKNPYEYNPNRWIDGSLDENFEQYAYTPFSAGPRSCLGRKLAPIQAKIVLGSFLKKFDYTIPEDYQLKINLMFQAEPLDRLKVDLKLN